MPPLTVVSTPLPIKAFPGDLGAVKAWVGKDRPTTFLAPSGHVKGRRGDSGRVRSPETHSLRMFTQAARPCMVMAPRKNAVTICKTRCNLDRA